LTGKPVGVQNTLACPQLARGQTRRAGDAASQDEAQTLADTEVVMNADKQVRIDVEAAKALAQWKSLFATEVCDRAKRLAGQSNHPNCVTLSHYRQAALVALQSLSDTILAEEGPRGQQEAA
jgi:hypothetical protein